MGVDLQKVCKQKVKIYLTTTKRNLRHVQNRLVFIHRRFHSNKVITVVKIQFRYCLLTY
jgi:hypothetical protein